MTTVKLNNGIKFPVIGIGTFMLAPKDAEDSTREALKMGYRMVDTANAYVNERANGGSGLRRARQEVRENSRSDHSALAYADGLRCHPRQQKRRSHQG